MRVPVFLVENRDSDDFIPGCSCRSTVSVTSTINTTSLQFILCVYTRYHIGLTPLCMAIGLYFVGFKWFQKAFAPMMVRRAFEYSWVFLSADEMRALPR